MKLATLRWSIDENIGFRHFSRIAGTRIGTDVLVLSETVLVLVIE